MLQAFERFTSYLYANKVSECFCHMRGSAAVITDKVEKDSRLSFVSVSSVARRNAG